MVFDPATLLGAGTLMYIASEFFGYKRATDTGLARAEIDHQHQDRLEVARQTFQANMQQSSHNHQSMLAACQHLWNYRAQRDLARLQHELRLTTDLELSRAKYRELHSPTVGYPGGFLGQALNREPAAPLVLINGHLRHSGGTTRYPFNPAVGLADRLAKVNASQLHEFELLTFGKRAFYAHDDIDTFYTSELAPLPTIIVQHDYDGESLTVEAHCYNMLVGQLAEMATPRACRFMLCELSDLATAVITNQIAKSQPEPIDSLIRAQAAFLKKELILFHSASSVQLILDLHLALYPHIPFTRQTQTVITNAQRLFTKYGLWSPQLSHYAKSTHENLVALLQTASRSATPRSPQRASSGVAQLIPRASRIEGVHSTLKQIFSSRTKA